MLTATSWNKKNSIAKPPRTWGHGLSPSVCWPISRYAATWDWEDMNLMMWFISPLPILSCHLLKSKFHSVVALSSIISFSVDFSQCMITSSLSVATANRRQVLPQPLTGVLERHIQRRCHQQTASSWDMHGPHSVHPPTSKGGKGCRLPLFWFYPSWWATIIRLFSYRLRLFGGVKILQTLVSVTWNDTMLLNSALVKFLLMTLWPWCAFGASLLRLQRISTGINLGQRNGPQVVRCVTSKKIKLKSPFTAINDFHHPKPFHLELHWDTGRNVAISGSDGSWTCSFWAARSHAGITWIQNKHVGE